MTETGEVDVEASGQASARGSACSKERRAAELLDTVARRRDDGECDYGDGAVAVASAMERESEGERHGENGCVHGVRGATWRSSRPAERRGEEAGRRTAAWHALVRHRAPACLPGRAKQLARAVAALGRQVGLLGGAR